MKCLAIPLTEIKRLPSESNGYTSAYNPLSGNHGHLFHLCQALSAWHSQA